MRQFPVDPFDAPYLSGQIVGVGTGGSITLQFNTPIQNNPATLSAWISSSSATPASLKISEPAPPSDGSLYTGGTSDVRVSVSADGTTFYTLNPAIDARWWMACFQPMEAAIRFCR